MLRRAIPKQQLPRVGGANRPPSGDESRFNDCIVLNCWHYPYAAAVSQAFGCQFRWMMRSWSGIMRCIHWFTEAACKLRAIGIFRRKKLPKGRTGLYLNPHSQDSILLWFSTRQDSSKTITIPWPETEWVTQNYTLCMQRKLPQMLATNAKSWLYVGGWCKQYRKKMEWQVAEIKSIIISRFRSWRYKMQCCMLQNSMSSREHTENKV